MRRKLHFSKLNSITVIKFTTFTLLILGLAAWTAMGLAVINNTNETQAGNIDNQTWNFAQLEVDYLNLKKSTLKAKGATHINARQINEINFFFDIYYSRLNAVLASGHAILKGESGSELSNLLRQAEQHRNFFDKSSRYSFIH
jgi:beta-N-acetylglucosaminidase